jgi:hypothetical protein
VRKHHSSAKRKLQTKKWEDDFNRDGFEANCEQHGSERDGKGLKDSTAEGRLVREIQTRAYDFVVFARLV